MLPNSPIIVLVMDEDGFLSDNDLLIYNEWNDWFEWPEGELRRLNNTQNGPGNSGFNSADYIEVIFTKMLFSCDIQLSFRLWL